MKKTTLQNLGNQDILISTKERPIWQKILAVFFFTFMATCLYVFFLTIDFNADSKMAHFYGNTIELAGICFVLGVRYSIMKDYYFDLKEKKYKIVKRVGFVEIGKWRNFKDLDYISIFRNKKDILEVNLWYDENKHFNLGTLDNLKQALDAGKKIAQKLQLDLWDAGTNPYHGNWIPIKANNTAANNFA